MKNKAEGYDRVKIYDIANGAMWANKMDTVSVVSRPERFVEGGDIFKVEVHFDKVKNQKRVGRGGMVEYWFNPKSNRYSNSTMVCPVADAVKDYREKQTPELDIDNWTKDFWNE